MMFIFPRLTFAVSPIAIRVHPTGRYGCSVGIGGEVRMHVIEVTIDGADATEWIGIGFISNRDGSPIGYWLIRRAILMKRLTRARRWFRWVVAFEVEETWVADGFDLTDNRAHAMVANDLRYAYGHELRGEVLTRPRREDVNVAQGAKPNAKRDGWPAR